MLISSGISFMRGRLTMAHHTRPWLVSIWLTVVQRGESATDVDFPPQTSKTLAPIIATCQHDFLFRDDLTLRIPLWFLPLTGGY